MENVIKVTLEAFLEPVMLFGWQRGSDLTFYRTCLPMMWISLQPAALLVVVVHSYVLRVRKNVHRRHFATHNVKLVTRVAGKNQTKCVF